VAESKLEIWNAALDRIGESAPIEDEDDDRPAAGICVRHYDRLRKMVLKAFPWPFAKHQSALSQPDGVSRVGWAYVYELPKDCLLPRALLAEGMRIGLISSEQRIPFDIVSNDDGDGRLLCCDLGPTDFEVLEYTRDLENPVMFPPDFEDALAWRLAVELALGQRKDPRLAQTMQQGFAGAVSEAYASEMRGKQEDPEPEAGAIQARTGFVVGPRWPWGR
jgi:hypothetical protein